MMTNKHFWFLPLFLFFFTFNMDAGFCNNPPDKMYWGDLHDIKRSNLNGQCLESIYQTVSPFQVRTIRINQAAGEMYWTESWIGPGSIRKANLDGSNVQVILSNVIRPQGLALDVQAGKMYWAETPNSYFEPNNANAIYRANLDGTGKEQLINLLGASGVTLDLVNNKMYLPDFNRIIRTNLDGSGVEVLVTGLSNVQDIDLDLANGIMFYNELNASKIVRANLDGTGAQTIITGRKADMAIDLANAKLYCADQSAIGVDNDQIFVTNYDGSGEQVLYCGFNPRGIDLAYAPTSCVNDGSGNTACAGDGVPPTAVCKDHTVQFNGETSISLNPADIWDAINSTDNAGPVSFVSASPAQVNCSQAGSTVQVTVTIEDGSNNTAMCTSNVMVGGLPCGLTAPPNGINCASGNSAGYDANTDTYSITSQGCYDPAFYSNNDSHGYIGTTLCGDVEIIAEVSSVSGNGWAGITMRQSATTGAPMIQLAINNASISKKRFRYVQGATAFQQQYATAGRNWLRITRTGSLTQAFQSTDGMNWVIVLSVPIPFGSCVEMGMITENGDPSGTLNATFENVQINGGSPAPLSTPGADFDIAADYTANDFQLYPNPATNEAIVDLRAFMDQEVTIRVMNKNGQVMTQSPIDRVQDANYQLDLQGFSSGLYFVQVIAEGQNVMTKKLTVIGR